MGQHRLQPLMVAKHHHLNNAAYLKKLLIWSLGIMVPFLVLFCIFPSSSSLYMPSYDRIVVRQLHIPTSRFPSGDVLQPKLSSDDDPTNDEMLSSNDDEHTSDGDNDDSISQNVKKHATTAAENFGGAKTDSVLKATKKQSNLLEKEALSNVKVHNPPPTAATKAKKQKHEMMSEALSADEGDQSSSNAKKQSDGDDKKKQSDGLPKKAKKQKDGEEGDHEFSIVKEKKQSDTKEPDVSSIDDELDLSSKKAKKQTRGDDDEPEINAFMIEEEQNGEPRAETQKKEKNGELNEESETKKNFKKGKNMQHTEEMPEVELDETLSISGKKEADQPNVAEIKIKKSTKKTKAKTHDTDENIAETELNVEDSIATNKKANTNDEGPFTAKLSRKEKAFADLEEEKKKELEEEDEEDEFPQMEKTGKFFAKLGKSSDGGRSSAEDHASDVLFLKEADEEAFISEPRNAHKKTKMQSVLEEMEDSQYSPELEEVDGVEEDPFLGKRIGFNRKTKNVEVEREYSIIDEKSEEDMDSFESSPYKFATTKSFPSSQKDDSEEFSRDSAGISKRKKQIDSLRKVDNEDLALAVEDKSHIDEASIDDLIITKAVPLKTLSGKCRYFKGSWTMDTNYPLYKDSTCPWKSIDDEQRCKTTKKASAWRWQPSECSMKQFRANAFLKLMQGKSVAFVGDNMVKSQLKSLVCLLAEKEIPTLVYNDKSNQSMSWYFRSSNLTLSLIWSPYLVQQTSEDHYSKLQLDKLDTKWAEMVPMIDVLILGVGNQFDQPSLYKIRDDAVGCYSCQALSAYMDITNLKEISLYSGFRAAMRSSIMGIGALPGYNGVVLFLQPFGFEGNGSYYGISLKMKDIQEQELKKAQSRGSISNQSIMEVLHTNFNSESNYDPLKGLYSPTCFIPNPLADTWNQVLQHTLARIFPLELDT